MAKNRRDKGRHMKVRTSISLVATAGLALVLLAACSAPPSTILLSPPTESGAPTQPAQVTPTTPVPKELGSATWKYKSSEGYTWSITYTVWEPFQADSSGPVGHPGDAGRTLDPAVDYDPARDLVIPVRVEIQNTTTGFVLKDKGTGVSLIGIYNAAKVADGIRLVDYDGQELCNFEVMVTNAQIERIGFGRNGGPINMTWSSVPPAAHGTSVAFVILRDYYTPAAPQGEKVLLGKLALAPDSLTWDTELADKKPAVGITLSGKVVSGN